MVIDKYGWVTAVYFSPDVYRILASSSSHIQSKVCPLSGGLPRYSWNQCPLKDCVASAVCPVVSCLLRASGNLLSAAPFSLEDSVPSLPALSSTCVPFQEWRASKALFFSPICLFLPPGDSVLPKLLAKNNEICLQDFFGISPKQSFYHNSIFLE